MEGHFKLRLQSLSMENIGKKLLLLPIFIQKSYLGKEGLGCQGLFGSVATNITCNMLFKGNDLFFP